MAWCTIVVPTFNGAPFIGDLIQSLTDQFGIDCDLLFFDDGSTDDTISTIIRCGISPEKIIINKLNIGLYATLNLAAKIVSTEYMSILFQDDWVMPNYVARMQEVSKRYSNVSFIWPAINIVDVDWKALPIEGPGHWARGDYRLRCKTLVIGAKARYVLDHKRVCNKGREH